MSVDLMEINNKIKYIIDDLKDAYSSFYDLNEESKIKNEKSLNIFFDSMKKNLDEQVLKIAVVGAIKSGKSTFINSFLKSDFLKRGAGVITSVVTRVVQGEKVRAVVSFKSIEEINKEIIKSVVLLPNEEESYNFEDFDLINPSDREKLSLVLEQLETDQLISSESREAKSVYLQSYLKGYKRLEHLLEHGFKEFFEGSFEEYKDFASDESLAVYVKDIFVEIPEKSIDKNTEIADCQGSDSTNPLHLARIQDYLLSANFIIYLISTRTGLRQADIKFMNILKKMGLIDQSIFVLNSDISEHEDIKDLNRVENSTIEEINIIKPGAKVFTISALYELFCDNLNTLSKKESLRLEQWNLDNDSTKYLHDNFLDFRKYFDEELILKKQFFFYSSCTRKLKYQSRDLKERIELKKSLISKDDSENRIDLKGHEKKFGDVTKLIKNTLDGSKQRYDNNLKNDINSFFDFHSEGMGRLFNFINNYTSDFEKYIIESENKSLSVNYFSLYQDFKKELDNFVTQEISPVLISFVKEKENEIINYFYELSKSYESMVFDALSNLSSKLNTKNFYSTSTLIHPDDFNIEKRFNLPSALDLIDYNIAIRSSALAGSGLVFFKNLLNKVFKGNRSIKSDAIKTINKSLDKIKKETEASLKNHIVNYRENLKFQYILKFSKEVKESYYNLLTQRLNSFIKDFSNIKEIMEKNIEERDEFLREIDEVYLKADEVLENLLTLESKISTS